MIMKEIGYDLSEKDIDQMVDILKVVDEPNATAENAISFLLYIKQNARAADPDKLAEFYSEFRSAAS